LTVGPRDITLVDLPSGNAQQFWEALASVSGDHAIIVADLTAPAACDWAVKGALIMVLRCTGAGQGSCTSLREARWSARS